MSRSVVESVSAFANAEGGLLVLGLDESNDFRPVPIDAAKLASDLAAACPDQLEPAIRPEVDIVAADDHPVVVAVIDPLPVAREPCFVKARGIERGSFLRTHDGDCTLTTYEVHILYRTLTGCDALRATRELTGMAAAGLLEKSNDRRWARWHLVRDERYRTDQPSLPLEVRRYARHRRDRRAELRRLLADGSQSSNDLAEHLGITKEGVLR